VCVEYRAGYELEQPFQRSFDKPVERAETGRSLPSVYLCRGLPAAEATSDPSGPTAMPEELLSLVLYVPLLKPWSIPGTRYSR
jgi:hypothetical protein